MTRTTGSVPAGSVGLDRAVERLSKTRPVLWVLMVLMSISAFRSISFRHLRMTDWSALAGLLVAFLLLLAYGDALAQLRTLRNQRNLERAVSTHAWVWAAMAISAVWQLL